MALEPPRWPECCIYRVPKRLREVKPKAYTPRLVSIGPFHHCIRKELKDMEIQKLRYLRDFCCRTGKSIEDLTCIIKRNEIRIRHCYSETFRQISSEEFVKMILLDAIFILELFCRKYETDYYQAPKEEKSDKDYILSQPCTERSLMHDLLLLENQLPFFILEELCGNVKLVNVGDQLNGEPKIMTLLQLSSCFFGGFFYIRDNVKGEHFTDLLRSCFCTHHPEPQNLNYDGVRYTATQFDEAGLKFTHAGDSKSSSPLQIRLPDNWCLETFPYCNLSWLFACLPCLQKSTWRLCLKAFPCCILSWLFAYLSCPQKSTWKSRAATIPCCKLSWESTCLRRMQRFLEIPTLFVDDSFEVVFRNLMALEQCHYPKETYICYYIALLDDLITTEADVMLLVDKKIIVNGLGSNKAVTDLFNNLCLETELSSENLLYGELCEELNDYYENPWNRLVGTLTRVYFSDFFKGTATVVGIIVLVFTFWNFNQLLAKL